VKLIEQFTQGKTGDDSLNEDHIVITGDFIAVLDGATSFTGLKLNGVPNGRFASRAAGEGVEKLRADISAFEAVKFLTAHLRDAVEKAAPGVVFDTPDSRPASALLIYSRARREIWRLADSPFAIDGAENQRPIPIIDSLVGIRKSVLEAHLALRKSEREMLDNDPIADTWKTLIPPLQVFMNHDGPYGWSMLNGQPVPEKLIEVYAVPAGAKEIELASDGYLKLCGDLAKTEAHLQGVMSRDPLMLREYPQVKGRKTGWVSFDDRAYVRFAL